MEKIFYTILFLKLLFFLSCEANIASKNKFFHPDDLDRLSLDRVTNFWDTDSIVDISDYVTANFNLHPNHLSSIRYCGVKGNTIEVSVFETQENAIEAMEERILNVSALILPGDSYGDFTKEDYDFYTDQYWSKQTKERIDDKWWWGIYGMGIQQRMIFINKWNTIIGASNCEDDFSDSARLHIEDAAIEVTERVDILSQ